MTRNGSWKFGTKPIIGLTGGIGAGKSFVAAQLAKLGCGVIDADALSRQAMTDQTILMKVHQRWGDGVFTVNEELDRKALAGRIFADPAQRKELEAIVHPYVHAHRAIQREHLLADVKIVAIVEDCPLLYESGLDEQVDVTIFVATDEKTRRQRALSTRGWSAEELASREKNQLKLDTKAQCADYVINNNEGEKDCFDQARIVLSRILHSHDRKV